MRGVVNPVVLRLVSSSGRAGQVLVLGFTGRRTGRGLSVPVMGHDVEGVLHVFTDAAWAANFRGGRAVTVTGRGRRLDGTGYLLCPSEGAAVLRSVLRETDPRHLGLHVLRGAIPTDAELAAVRHAVRIVKRAFTG